MLFLTLGDSVSKAVLLKSLIFCSAEIQKKGGIIITFIIFKTIMESDLKLCLLSLLIQIDLFDQFNSQRCCLQLKNKWLLKIQGVHGNLSKG